jgi:hypothetical protein
MKATVIIQGIKTEFYRLDRDESRPQMRKRVFDAITEKYGDVDFMIEWEY